MHDSDDNEDLRLGPLGEMVRELLPDPDRESAMLQVRELTVDLPFEVYPYLDDAGRLRLDASPPSQTLETGLVPVMHRMRVRVQAMLREPEED